MDYFNLSHEEWDTTILLGPPGEIGIRGVPGPRGTPGSTGGTNFHTC